MKSDPPSGTVTFLFTDIEKSTRLWEEYPKTMKAALVRHYAILRQSIEAQSGYVVETTGDGLLAAFENAVSGVVAALAGQRALSAETWEEIKPGALRVRMGLHTGAAEIRPGGYSGPVLNRAARLMSIGHGGQILLSTTTADLVRDQIPGGVLLRDLGEHRLKDLTRPEHVYQLVHPDLRADFPALRSPEALQDGPLKKIRVLIADDHILFREGLRALLNATPDIEVVGEAADGEAAIMQVPGVQPDVILMDIHMPGISGIEATRRILDTRPGMGIIMVTMLEDDASVFAAMKAGARGYVLKGAHHDDILQAIHTVAGGQTVFGPAIAARIMTFFQNLDSTSKPSRSSDNLPELTDPERDVLRLMTQGANNKDIAQKLGISSKTVSISISGIFRKLQVVDRAQAVHRARDAGLR